MYMVQILIDDLPAEGVDDIDGAWTDQERDTLVNWVSSALGGAVDSTLIAALDR